MALLDFITSQKPADVERRLRLAQGLSGMSTNPNIGLQSAIQGRLEGIAAQRQKDAAAKLAEAQRNKTAQWLATQGRTDLAQGILNGSLTGAQAFELFKQKPTAEFEILTPQEVAATAGLDPQKAYKRNKVTKEVSAIGGAGVSVNIGDKGEDAWSTETAKLMSKQLDSLWEGGASASTAKHNLFVLQDLGASMDKGTAIPTSLRDWVPEGVDSNIDAYRSVLYNVAKSLRQSGTGPMTDKDFDVLMKQAGGVSTDAKARGIAQSMLMRKANIDLQIASIANQAITGAIAREDAYKKIQELRNNPVLTPEERSYLEQLGSTSSTQIPVGEIDAANAALEAALKEKQKRQQGL